MFERVVHNLRDDRYVDLCRRQLCQCSFRRAFPSNERLEKRRESFQRSRLVRLTVEFRFLQHFDFADVHVVQWIDAATSFLDFRTDAVRNPANELNW